MKSRFALFAVLVGCLAAQPAAVRGDDYKVDESHTSIIFGINHMGLSYTYGRFNKYNGTYTLDAADPTKCEFKLAIDAMSVDTNNPGRDDHLRGPELLQRQGVSRHHVREHEGGGAAGWRQDRVRRHRQSDDARRDQGGDAPAREAGRRADGRRLSLAVSCAT